MEQNQDSILELEHAIGFSGTISSSVLSHPNGRDFVYIAGACVVICDINDPHQQYFLRGHDDQVTAIAISNDGNLIASGQKGDNSDIIIWDFQSKKIRFRLSEHDHCIVCLDFSHDDKLLFSCGNSADKKQFIWDTSNGFIVGSCIMIPDPIISARFGGFAKDIKGRETSKYQLATCGNKQIALWKFDARTGIFEHDIINTGWTIREYTSVEFSLNKEEFLYAGTTSGDFFIFQIKNKVVSALVSVCALGVTSVTAIDTDIIACGGGNGTLALFKTENSVVTPLAKTMLTGSVNSLSFCQESNLLISATDKGFIYRTTLSDAKTYLHSENHTSSVVYLAYPQKVSDRFGSCSEDGTIRLWDVSEYLVTARCIALNAGMPLSLVYTDEVVISGWQDGRIRMFKSEDGSLVWQLENAHKGGVTAILLSNNYKFICSGGADGEVRVWELRSRQMVSHLKEHTSRVTKLYLFPNDLHLLSASRDKALLCWDLKSEKRVSAHIQRMGGINSFDVVPQSQTVLTTGQSRKITFWNLKETEPIKNIDTNNNPKSGDECFCLAISNNGQIFATGGSEQIVRVWDLKTTKLIAEGKGHSGTINYLAFSYDDKQLVSGGKDGCIFLWNIFL